MPQTTLKGLWSSGLRNGENIRYRWIHYRKPTNYSSIKLRMVVVELSRNDFADGTLYVELWSDNNGVPGSKIGDIGSMNVADITTDSAGPITSSRPRRQYSLTPKPITGSSSTIQIMREKQ